MFLKVEAANEIQTALNCYHCGENCPDDSIRIGDKYFCCNGCKTVYEILDSNEMCDYYAYGEKPGIKKTAPVRSYSFLDDPALQEKLINFTDGKTTSITFSIPQMHCSSCIWVLENLYKFNAGIKESKADFLKKSVAVKFNPQITSLREVVELLDSIGYEPNLNLDSGEGSVSEHSRKLYYRIGISGFCFGNIMLLSFPEYLSIVDNVTNEIRQVFGFLNLLLALPVFFYSSGEYFSSAYKGLKKKFINIDVPIALGISVLFFRSLYEIVFQAGPGYFDSLAGLVFFLLIGRLFQNKTYDTLNFERNYKSYFPIAVTIKEEKNEKTSPLDKLEIGNRLIIKNNELIPTDSVLISKNANIDYSFVTGESLPVERKNGDLIYAGGRQIGSVIEIESIKKVSQSYLTELWNNETFTAERESRITTLANNVSKYFTAVILFIAFGTGLFWYFADSSAAFDALTAVLIIACPCALALSTPFTLGSTMRIFGRNKFYIKNTAVVENLANINSIIFDKTGTITDTSAGEVFYEGDSLQYSEKEFVKSLVNNSSHPLSQKIFHHLKDSIIRKADVFKEIAGHGIEGTVDENLIKLGSQNFVRPGSLQFSTDTSSRVFVSINNVEKGFFRIKNTYRPGLEEIVQSLKSKFKLAVLSGDNESEKEHLQKIFSDNSDLMFNQSPQDKLNYIRKLQSKENFTLMIGDGLNDAGALAKSDVGITITENVNNFSPACDGILDSKSFAKLSTFLLFSRLSKKIIIASFVLSFLYNAIGLTFAVQGALSPLIAAILMPLSSITVVIFTYVSVNFFAKMRGLL